MALGRGGRLTFHAHDDSSREALSLARFVSARGTREVVMLPLLGHTDSTPTQTTASSNPDPCPHTNSTAAATTGYVASAHDLQVIDLSSLCLYVYLSHPPHSLIHSPSLLS